MIVTPRPNLSALTTLGLGGFALAGITLERAEDFARLPETLAEWGGEPRVLSGGSNILAQDGELPVVLVRPLLGAEREPEDLGRDGGKILVKAGAGITLPALLSWCGRRGFSGLEGLVGIPGRLGGAVAMNAGAYGCEIGPCLRELDVWTPEDGFRTLKTGEWTASYRRFSPAGAPSWFVAAKAVLALEEREPEEVQAAMRANMEKKKSSQPVNSRTAGCVFKNPKGESAGNLLEQAGMRGREKGGMWFSHKHANFLANKGGGSFSDARELIEEARQAVKAKFGITLELEVRIWSWPQP